MRPAGSGTTLAVAAAHMEGRTVDHRPLTTTGPEAEDEGTVSSGRVVSIAGVAALGGFLFGYDSAVINGAVSAIQEKFDVAPGPLGFAVASALLGAALGAVVAGRFADRYGRLFVMRVAAVLFLVSAIGTGLAANLEVLVLFRVVGGIGVGVVSVIAPAYIAEVSPAHVRFRKRRTVPDVLVKLEWPSPSSVRAMSNAG